MAGPVTSRRTIPGVLAIVALTLCAPVFAQCELDASTTSVINPDDPGCRDVMYTYTEKDSAAGRIRLGYPVPLPVDSLTGVDGFRSYSSLLARHQDLALMNPAVQAVTVGQSRAGRDIWAYRLGDADERKADGSLEAAVMVNGTIHAREWQSPEGVTELYEQLVEIAADGGWGQYLAENLTVVLLPVLNVDGFTLTQAFPDRFAARRDQPREGRMRRKNLHHPSRGSPVDEDIDTTDDTFFGVDLNRNSARGFGLNQGSLADVYSLIYRGPSAASEPETKALLAAADLGPRTRLRMYTDLHSYTQVFFTPQTANSRRNAITRDLAARMREVTGNRYRYSPDPVDSGGIGTTADYFAYELNIPSWTLETEPANGGQDYGGTGASGSGFVLPDAEVARMRDELADMFLLGFYRMAGPPSVAALRLFRADNGAPVYDAAWVTGPDGTARQQIVSTDEGLAPGEQYTLWLAFDKPMRYRNSQGAPGNYPGQSVELSPDIILAIPGSGDDGLTIPLDGASFTWLDQPGGAPNGYHRYRDDALTTSFQVPADAATDTPLAAVLQVQAHELSEQSLDGDPATPADFAAGHWTGYEDAFGAEGDLGGAACAFWPWIDTPAGGSAPAVRDVACPAAKQAAPPVPAPPVPAPPPPAAHAPAPQDLGGGGGVATSGLFILAGLVFVRQRRR